MKARIYPVYCEICDAGMCLSEDRYIYCGNSKCRMYEKKYYPPVIFLQPVPRKIKGP